MIGLHLLLVLPAIGIAACEDHQSVDTRTDSFNPTEGVFDEPDPHERWTYEGKFQRAIASADRVVVRDGGFNCCGPVDDDKVLIEVTEGHLR